MTRYRGDEPVKTGSTSLGAHVRALACLLMNSIADEVEGGPSTRVVQLRDHLRALTRAYPQYLAFSEVDLMQALAEEDGIPQED